MNSTPVINQMRALSIESVTCKEFEVFVDSVGFNIVPCLDFVTG